MRFPFLAAAASLLLGTVPGQALTCRDVLVHTAADRAPVLAHEIETAVRLALGWGPEDPVEPERLGGTLNHYYRIGIRGGLSAVLEVSDPNEHLFGVERSQEREATRRAAAEGLAPAVLFAAAGDGVLVTRYAGEPVPVTNTVALDEVAQALRALHAIDPTPGLTRTFSPFRNAELLRRSAESQGVRFSPSVATAFETMESIERALGSDSRSVPSHNALRPSCVRRDEAGTVRFVAWEHAGLAEPMQDAAVFAREAGLDDARSRRFLGAYLDGEVTARAWARFRLLGAVADLRAYLDGQLRAALLGAKPSTESERRLTAFLDYTKGDEYRRDLVAAAGT
jgi:thiamine kinase-like enzyme